MSARLLHRLLPVLFAQAWLAADAVCAATKEDEKPRSEIRLVVEEEPVGPSIASPRPPSPSTQTEVETPWRPQVLGDDLLQPSPNVYESTVPTGPPPGYQLAPPTYEDWQNYSPRRSRIRQLIEHRPRQAPLPGESWLNRPYSFGLFVGGIFLDNPRPGIVEGDAGVMFGTRIGWDFAPNWGVEGRWGIAKPGLRSLVGDPDIANANVNVLDMSWLWYPTGDTRWRPFFKLGFGYLDIDYFDGTGFRQHNAALEIPFGVGMKYHHSSRMSMRIDLTDNFASKTGVQSSMQNVSLTSGFEWHWGGGTRRNYWPWNPGRDY